MRVAILEDYQQASPALACFAKLTAHEVRVFSEPMRDEATIASRIAGPVMDAAHPLVAMPDVTATPHLGFVERASYEKYFGDAFDAVNAFASGKPIRAVL